MRSGEQGPSPPPRASGPAGRGSTAATGRLLRVDGAGTGRSAVSGAAGRGGSVHVLVLAQVGRVHKLDYLLRHLLLKDDDLGETASLSPGGMSVLSRPPRPPGKHGGAGRAGLRRGPGGRTPTLFKPTSSQTPGR